MQSIFSLENFQKNLMPNLHVDFMQKIQICMKFYLGNTECSCQFLYGLVTQCMPQVGFYVAWSDGQGKCHDIMVMRQCLWDNCHRVGGNDHCPNALMRKDHHPIVVGHNGCGHAGAL